MVMLKEPRSYPSIPCQLRRGLHLLCCTLLAIQLATCQAGSELDASLAPGELLASIEAGTAPFILDVRTPAEYMAGHIPGAVNIHVSELEQRLDEMPGLSDAPIVVYCERGIRAGVAETTLEQAGFTAVVGLQGDISAWRRAGLPLDSGENLPESRGPAAEGMERVAAIAFSQQWIVSAADAKALIDQGATVLDARGQGFKLTRLQGAIPITWSDFSPDQRGQRGRLLEEDADLTEQLQALGIDRHRPVVVFANPPHGWGEDGRIVWMLRTLGHPQVVLVDGGVAALLEAGVPRQQRAPVMPPPGEFVVQRDLTWTIQRDELQAQLATGRSVIIDTREPREYAGQTPYGEPRGGHIPGAIHLYFKDLLAANGRLLAPAELQATVQDLGLTPDQPVVVYCTGGVRSAWVASVLITLGFQVKNYAGSMWEWAAAPRDRYPLVTP